MNVRIPEAQQDKQLKTKWEAELPGILNFALDGLKRLKKTERFTECAAVREATEQHRLECDPVRKFLREHVREDQAETIPVADLYKRYQVEVGIHGTPLVSSAEFGKTVKRTFPEVQKTRPGSDKHRHRVYRGLAWSKASMDVLSPVNTSNVECDVEAIQEGSGRAWTSDGAEASGLRESRCQIIAFRHSHWASPRRSPEFSIHKTRNEVTKHASDCSSVV